MKVGKKMALQADRQDYRNAYNKHWNAWNNTGSVNSRRLLLTYSVECGLKCALMEKEKVYRVSDAQKEVQEVLGTHDFRKLLKKLRIIGTFTFPTIQTNHNDVVQPGQYHELCRYSIQPKNNDDTDIKEFEETLKNIGEWLGGQL